MKWLTRCSLLVAVPCLGLTVLAQFSMALIASRHAQIQVERGSIQIYWQPNGFGSWSISLLPPAGSIVDAFASGYRVQALNINGSPDGRLTYLVLPHWLTNLIAWSLFLILWRKSLKQPTGHCQRCGYDLTGNESGACPECGLAAGQNDR